MDKKYLTASFVVSMVLLISLSAARAQTEITFKIDLKSQMKDSVFVPGRGDVVQVQGDLYPLSPNQLVTLEDEKPIDSVFTTQIRFPANQRGKNLSYNYILELPEQTKTEMMPRSLRIRGQEIELRPVFFNTFAY